MKLLSRLGSGACCGDNKKGALQKSFLVCVHDGNERAGQPTLLPRDAALPQRSIPRQQWTCFLVCVLEGDNKG